MTKNRLKNSSKDTKEKKSNKKIIIAVLLICFAFFGSYLIYFIMQVALNTPNPMVVVVSESMEPNIHIGDLLFLKGVDDPATIKNGTIEGKEGDIIVYDARGLWAGAPEEPIVHRVVNNTIVNETGYFFWTKGDANDCIDPPELMPCDTFVPIPANRIIGVVVGGIPYIGLVKIFLEKSGLLIPILVILSILLIISIIWDLVKEDEEKSKKAEKKQQIKKLDKIENNKNKDQQYDF